jgi:hypothetical protein
MHGHMGIAVDRSNRFQEQESSWCRRGHSHSTVQGGNTNRTFGSEGMLSKDSTLTHVEHIHAIHGLHRDCLEIMEIDKQQAVKLAVH